MIDTRIGPMSENVLQTLQQLVQDVIAPDVRELKANQASLEKQIAALEKHMDVRFNSADQKTDARFDAIDARFDALMSAISESRAQAELTNLRVIASLSERVAVLETKRQ
jgi:uncharacterized protein YicC (UPF0701 family)